MGRIKHLGPYHQRDRSRWQVIRVAADGSRRVRYFRSRAEAQTFKSMCERIDSDRPVCEVIETFIEHLAPAVKASTLDTVQGRLDSLFEDNPQLSAISASWLQRQLDQRLADEQSVAYCRALLKTAKRLMDWAAAQGLCEHVDLSSCKVAGVARRGKPTLTTTEARRFLESALSYRLPHWGTAAGMALLTGAGASELLNRVVRDLDCDATLLWVRRGKTPNRDRTLAIPAILAPRMRALAADKGPLERLWNARATATMHKHVTAICALAEVPVIGSHALRATHASLATVVTGTSELVARQLGHGSPSITNACYASLASQAEASMRRVTDSLLPTGLPTPQETPNSRD